MFPILAENLTQSILHADKELRQMGKLFHIGRYNYFTQIYYPQVKPFLYSGLATATGFGWRAVIMGEVLSQCSSGIGSEMKKSTTIYLYSGITGLDSHSRSGQFYSR